MATLWIREYKTLARPPYWAGDGQGEPAPIPPEPGTDQTPVTFTTSTQSAAFGVGTAYIRCYASAAFHYVVGVDPTATTNAMKWPADTPLEVGVRPGDKIAVIAAA